MWRLLFAIGLTVSTAACAESKSYWFRLYDPADTRGPTTLAYPYVHDIEEYEALTREFIYKLVDAGIGTSELKVRMYLQTVGITIVPRSAPDGWFECGGSKVAGCQYNDIIEYVERPCLGTTAFIHELYHVISCGFNNVYGCDHEHEGSGWAVVTDIFWEYKALCEGMQRNE